MVLAGLYIPQILYHPPQKKAKNYLSVGGEEEKI